MGYEARENERSNLVALCPACHLDLHRGGKGNVSEGQTALFLYFQRACSFAVPEGSVFEEEGRFLPEGLPVEGVEEKPVEQLELLLGEI